MPCSPTFVALRCNNCCFDQATTGGEFLYDMGCLCIKEVLGVNATGTNKGNDKVEDYTRPVAGANCSTWVLMNSIVKM
jgi:hypothetical protein